MIEYFYKHNNKHVVGNSKDYAQFKKDISTKGFLCFMVQKPTDIDIKSLCKDYGFDERPFRKFGNETRSLRYNFNPLTFTFTDYYTINGKVKTSHLLFIIKNNLLILVVSENSKYYSELFHKVVSNARAKKKHSEAYILYEFLHQDAKENYDVLESMDDKASALEKKVLSNVRNDKEVIHEIVSLKKELVQMSKRLWASSKVIFTIKKDLTSITLTKDEMSLLDDIYDTFLHQIDLIETQKETITDYLEIFTTTISNRLSATSNELNMVMKKMAALTIIIMVPTLIVGIYGTNFHNLPEITWKYGYFYMWIFMVIGSGLTYYFFHKRGWV
jgi:magnesium transporter